MNSKRSWLVMTLAIAACLVLVGCSSLDKKVPGMAKDDPLNGDVGIGTSVAYELQPDGAGGWQNGPVRVYHESWTDSAGKLTGSAANAGAAWMGFYGITLRNKGSIDQDVRYSGGYTVHEPDLRAAGESLADGIYGAGTAMADGTYGAGKAIGDGLATQGAAQADGMVGAAKVQRGRH